MPRWQRSAARGEPTGLLFLRGAPPGVGKARAWREEEGPFSPRIKRSENERQAGGGEALQEAPQVERNRGQP